MEIQRALDRRTLAGVGVGFLLAAVIGGGAAVAAQVQNVNVVNVAPVPVSVKNIPAVDVLSLPEREPFQWYGRIETFGTQVLEVPDGQRLVMTYINSRDTDGEFVEIEIRNAPGGTQRVDWTYHDADISQSVLLYAPGGTEVWIFEGTTATNEPYGVISGYLEPE